LFYLLELEFNIYTGDLITQTQFYGNEILKSRSEFLYNSEEKMSQRKTFDLTNNRCNRCEFIYNNDGTVSITAYSGDFTTQNTQIVNRKAFLFSNGDVEKIEEYVVIDGSNHTKTTHYTYDNKNSPLNTVPGYNKLKFWDTGNSGNSHNNTSIINTTTQNTSTQTEDLTYTYNSFDYPITKSFYGVNVNCFYE
jgi:hypothetical protein